jgi:pyruvate dehydrogenase E2 component (dihydrolipoamide acetyltransferase)
VAFEFRLPDIGEGLTEAEVIEWLVEVGQEVKLDQPLVQIETDKAVTDIPAPRAGVLLHQGARAGTVVRVGALLAVIGQPGEPWSSTATGPTPATAEAKMERATIEGSLPIVGTLPEASPPSAGRGEKALPLVRKLAKELGVDLSTVQASGPDGRVTREDVEAAAGAAAATPGERPTAGAQPRAGTQPPAGSPPPGPGEERTRLSRLRRTIAENMARSWREIPHVTTFGEADASRLLSVRKVLSERRAEHLPVEALFVRAVLPALQNHPQFNATLDGEDLILKRGYDIGLAVDTPEGLIVVVLRDADRPDLWALAKEIARLTDAARSRTAGVRDVTGASFTISNIGAVGGGYGTPIIPYGTTAILSFGRAEQRPVVRDGRIEAGTVMPLSLSYDHRVIDGALGRRFMADVIQSLEEPALIVAT